MPNYGLTESEKQARDLIARLAAQKEAEQKKELAEQIAHCRKQFKEIQKEWDK
jgi:hypothetical protein